MEAWLWIIIVLAVLLVIASTFWCCCRKRLSHRGADREPIEPTEVVPEAIRDLAEIRDSDQTIDLHFLTKANALRQLKDYLDRKDREFRQKRDSRSVNVITGKGLHSAGRKPVLKPAVQGFLQNNGYKFEVPVHNTGMFVVDLPRR